MHATDSTADTLLMGNIICTHQDENRYGTVNQVIREIHKQRVTRGGISSTSPRTIETPGKKFHK